ncbi:extended synaptotagmin-2-like isoform X2 [Haliotis rubra]|uniref:extended synaptotagmin-2-like isoform X2 n=1 Tax=Haliotis rubra TaxID=36100 RepID=UPI001EE4EF41|nr:extended synaptotagmin-2-like isoform X2 [Haliotis rubra]
MAAVLRCLVDWWLNLIGEIHRKFGIGGDSDPSSPNCGVFKRVIFPETDQAEWLNKVIQQLWPFVGDFMADILKKNVEPELKKAVMDSFTFSKVDMGTKPLRVEGVRVYNIRRGEIYMDLDLCYDGDADIDIGLLVSNAAGIQQIKLLGTLRVVLKPLLSAAPLVGGVSVFFITNPILDFDLTNLANIMDIPMFNTELHAIIQRQLSDLLVFPKRMEYIIGEGVKFSKLRCPRPQGVLAIHVKEAKDLMDADGIGISDPYAKVKVGDQTFQTAILENRKDAKWDQKFDALVDLAEERLVVTVLDEDTIGSDECLGTATVHISRVIEAGKIDEWFPLEGGEKGSINLALQWYYLANDASMLKNERECPRCLLMVCVDSAKGLLKPDQKPEDVSPVVSLSFKEQEFTSTEAAAAPEPSWQQDFRFLMTCAGEQMLSLKVKDSKNDTVYGTVEIDIKDLIGAPDMVLDQSYPLFSELQGITPELNLKLVLRVLTPDTDPRWLADSFQ